MKPALIVALAFLAGCLGPPEDAPTAIPPMEDAAPQNPLFNATACTQYHAYFSTPADNFRHFLPPGFALDTTQADTFDLRFETTRCDVGDGPMLQVWIELPIVPPAELNVPDHAALLPIEAYASDEDLVAALQQAGVGFALPCQCAATTLATQPALVESLATSSTNGDYTLRATMAPDSGPFGSESWARYIANDGELAGVILAHDSDATNRGTGTVQFQYVGPGGAPPLHGGIIHSVSGVGVELRVLA